jgi:p24 family protein beta-1
VCIFTTRNALYTPGVLNFALVISFNVHGVIYVGDDADGAYPAFVCNVVLFIFSADVVAPIEREIRALAHGLTSVKDEQEYIVVRERTHRNTAESTNSRVKWWSILQAIVLFFVVAWQVYYLKVIFTSYLPLPPS